LLKSFSQLNSAVMSANATRLLATLRELISNPTVNLSALAREADVNYYNLRSLKMEGRPLSIEDAEKVSVVLTGKTFISFDNV
jgi:hypothetical protein